VWGKHEQNERLDARLALLAREEAPLRLRLGQALEVLQGGKVFDLGFSSLSAYVLERCDRSVRWAEAARCLARRVEALPGLRHAIAAGAISWSMAELVARVAQPGDETRWLEAAEGRTVRQMRVLVAEAMAVGRHVAGSQASGIDVVGDAEEAAPSMDVPGSHGGVCVCENDAPENNDAFGSPSADDGVKASDGYVAREGEALDAVDMDVTDADNDDDGMCTLTCTVNQEEAWLFEATRLLLGQMGLHGTEAQSEALLAEGQGTLLTMLPEGALDLERLKGGDIARQRWARELARWRVEAEVLCEDRFCGLLWARRDERFHLASVDGSSARAENAPVDPREGGGHRAAEQRSVVAGAAARGMASLEQLEGSALDALVRQLSGALAQHELDVSRLVLRLHRAGGWRRLGYATEAQYARERLGCSISSLRGRRSLALRLEKLPHVAEALGAARIGVEAALQVVRVATGSTQMAWLERARQRTVKHLREEVTAALIAIRCSGEGDCVPPTEAEMVAFQELERAVVSGRVCGGEAVRVANDTHDAGGRREDTRTAKVRLAEPVSEQRRVWFVMLSSLVEWIDGGLQLSAGWPSRCMGSAGVEPSGVEPSGTAHLGLVGRGSTGRVTLRLRMSRSTCAWWRGLATQARRWLPRGVSWLRFLCLSMWEAWRHLPGSDVAYSEIYVRDCYRCLSPVCNRRDVTPHHLVFRSAGGSDDPANIASVCTWCHLWGVHGGRIRATGKAGLIHWEIGVGSPCLVVHGRERLAA
jgi:HAMP domain-containing protein